MTDTHVLEAVALAKSLCQYAYERGYHEGGYDPVSVLTDEIKRLRAMVAEEVADEAGANGKYIQILSQMRKPGGREWNAKDVENALKAAIRALKTPRAKRWNHERDCGLTNDAGTCECPQL